MASRFIKLFFNVDAAREANRQFRDRIAEINEHDAEVKAALAEAKAQNKAAFKARIAANTAKRNAQLKNGRY
jgi:hypothetical protein